MIGVKNFPHRLNSETYLFIILLGLTLFFAKFYITFVYGITFTFTSIFLFLIFRLFGLPLAIFSALLTFLFIPTEFIFISYNISILLEILFVGTYFYLKKRAKMFFVDAFFWLTLGLATLFFVNKPYLAGDALSFQICKDILNGLFNVLIADMLLAYFPFYRVLKTIQLSKNNVSVHQFLTHITIISIMIPFFLSILTKTWYTHEYINQQSLTQANNSASQIRKDLLLISNSEVDNDYFDENNQKGKLDEVVAKYKSSEYNVVITNVQNVVLATNSKSEKVGEYYNWNQNYDFSKISNDFSEALPRNQNELFPIINRRLGSLVYTENIDELSIKVLIQFPIAQYQDRIFKDFLIHLKVSLLFSFFTILFVLFVSRLFMNNLKQLISVTTNLPQRLIKHEKITWPQSSISELRLLTLNLKGMEEKLKELFEASNEMNRILTNQTKQLKESEEKLHQLAFYDTLTSLPNRLHFQNYIEELMKKKNLGKIAFIFIDLNHFKQINDTFGHIAGDSLLVLTANRFSNLRNNIREIFRISGDEFVIVEQSVHREEISKTIEIIRDAFSIPFNINGQELYISVSMGISIFPDDGCDLDTLLKCADFAMYSSKKDGGNAAKFFNEREV